MLSDAASERSAFMRPWDGEPRSIAYGILDDETYDWRSLVEGMLETDGGPVIVSEERLREAHRRASAVATRAPVCTTGSAGLAGLLELRAHDEVGEAEEVAVLFTGARR